MVIGADTGFFIEYANGNPTAKEIWEKHKMKGPMRVYYDEEGDFLEISAGKPSKCYASELGHGVSLRIDEKSEEVKSVGILGFKQRAKDLKDIKFGIPVEVNFSPIA